MNDVQIFKNEKLGLQVRVILNEDGSVSMNAEDTAIGYGWYRVEEKNGKQYKSILWARMNGYCKDLGFAHECAKDDYIPETLYYLLGMKASNENAKPFQMWIAADILPMVRKHGAYMTPQKIEEVLTDPDTIIQLATNLKTERQKRIEAEKQLEADRPKVLFADAVSASKSSILIGELAKLLKQNGIETGQKRLFEWLRENGYLMKQGSSKNMPTQKSMEAGLFEIKETTITNADGSIKVTKTPKVTGYGQQYFVNLFLSAKKEREPNASDKKEETPICR